MREIDPGATDLTLWSRLLAKSLEYGWPVYVGLEAESARVRTLLHANRHAVEAVGEGPDGTRAQFSGSHAVHFVSAARPGHERMSRRLHQAEASGRRVLVTQHPRNGDVIDVRWASEPAVAVQG
jgi:hypothetical protein